MPLTREEKKVNFNFGNFRFYLPFYLVFIVIFTDNKKLLTVFPLADCITYQLRSRRRLIVQEFLRPRQENIQLEALFFLCLYQFCMLGL